MTNEKFLHIFSIVVGEKIEKNNIDKKFEIVLSKDRDFDKIIDAVKKEYSDVYNNFSICYYGNVNIENNSKEINKEKKKEKYSQFIYNLEYCVDKFSKKIGKEDTVKLINIINKLK